MATEESRQAISVSLIGEIAAAYFELLDIDNRLKISERTVASREESIRIARLRKKGGVISKLEVQQAEVELASAKVTLPFLHKNRLIKENYLSILIGQAPGDIERRVGISEQALPPEVPVGLPGSLLQRRPDVRQAEQTLIAANAAIGIAKADFFPELTLTGAYGRESNELSDLLKSSGKTWIIGLDAIMPLFNAGKNRAQLAIAREQYEQASLNYRKIVLQSLKEVSDALESYSRSKEELEAHLDLVKSSQEYLRLATLRYYNGVLSYLDLLDAQRQLFNAELSLSESKRDRLVALVQLYKALGGGWQASEDFQG
jgi:NodT family efflux transporter outer membrane factor (OMF) lipoprotein